MQKQQGFTLIELMIVVAIIGILAAIAIPQYQNYVARSQVSEAISLTDGLKTDVLEYYSMNGSCPSNSDGAIGPAGNYEGKYVQGVTTGGSGGNCTITAQMKSDGVSPGLQNNHLQLQMADNSTAGKTGSASWTCSSSDIDAKYLPSSCTNSSS